MAASHTTCFAPACDRERGRKRLCPTHSSRLLRYGVLELPTTNTCGHCKVVFPRKNSRESRYCSTRCRNQAYWAENAERLREDNARWREAHREEQASKARAYRAQNNEHVRALEKISRDKRRDKINARAAIYREQNRDRINATVAEWGRRNLDRKLASNRARRARKQGNGQYTVTQSDIQRMVRRFDECCAYCSAAFTDANPMHVEHVVPIVRGGSDSIGNIVPACARCNLQKRQKTVMEWRVWKARHILAA